MRPGRRRHLEPGSYEALAEKRKASVRAKVEHPFLYAQVDPIIRTAMRLK